MIKNKTIFITSGAGFIGSSLISKKLIDDLINIRSNYIQLPVQYEQREHTWQTFHMLKKSNKRNQLIEYLKLKGIESNYGAYAIHTLSYYQKNIIAIFRLSKCTFCL